MADLERGDVAVRVLKLAVVLFGENLDPGTAGLAERIAAHS